MSTNQSTVLVKKADGTFARMTLDEIKQMRSGVAPVVPAKPIQRAEKPLKSTMPGGSSAMPQNDNKARTVQSQPNKATVSQPRVNQVEEVFKKLHFQVSPPLQNRLRSIIQLYLKDIRSADQTKDKIMQVVVEGGLGLGEKEADELLSVCGIILQREIKNNSLAGVPVLKKKNLLPMVEPNEIPAIATPFNAFVHGTTVIPTKPGRNDKANSEMQSGRSVLSMKPAVKVMMEDVQAPRPVEMGPVEEIQYMNLVDFRRLSAKPVEAAARLKQKFLNLRDESVVLYLDALSAWHKSPLYTDYMKNIERSLKEKRKMSALESGDDNKIKLEEILAIVSMEKELE